MSIPPENKIFCESKGRFA